MTMHFSWSSHLALVFVALTAACSGDGEIAVEPAASALTDKGGDALFTIKIVDARDGGYDLVSVVVKVTPDGKEAITLACTPADANANAKLDEGESLSCAEGAENQVDAALSGKDVKVEVFASDALVGAATWTPK